MPDRAAEEFARSAALFGDVTLGQAGLAHAPGELRWLGRARQERSAWMAYLAVETRLDRLRAAPGFAEVLRGARAGQMESEG